MSGDDRNGRPPVRLRLVDSPPPADRGGSGLQAEMQERTAAWDGDRRDERPVWLDEIGLEDHEVARLRADGAQIHVLRALGRRLRAEGRARTLAAYRALLGDDG